MLTRTPTQSTTPDLHSPQEMGLEGVPISKFGGFGVQKHVFRYCLSRAITLRLLIGLQKTGYLDISTPQALSDTLICNFFRQR